MISIQLIFCFSSREKVSCTEGGFLVVDGGRYDGPGSVFFPGIHIFHTVSNEVVWVMLSGGIEDLPSSIVRTSISHINTSNGV